MVLLVLGLCLPSSGEILVYKFTQNGSFYESDGTTWSQDKGPWKGYMVLDVTYTEDSASIANTAVVEYGTEGGDKWYEVNLIEGFTLVRVELGSKVLWVVLKAFSDETGGNLYMVSGSASARKVGDPGKLEAPNKLSGYGLDAFHDGAGGELGMKTFSGTLYPTWTYWANGAGEGEGNKSFEATTGYISTYLEGKGYVEQVDEPAPPTAQ